MLDTVGIHLLVGDPLHIVLELGLPVVSDLPELEIAELAVCGCWALAIVIAPVALGVHGA